MAYGRYAKGVDEVEDALLHMTVHQGTHDFTSWASLRLLWRKAMTMCPALRYDIGHK